MSQINLMPEDIAKTTVGDVFISTIICYSGFSESRVAETMVFIKEGATVKGLQDQDGERCGVHDAESQHAKWVAKVTELINASGGAA